MVTAMFYKRGSRTNSQKLATLEIEKFDNKLLDFMQKWFEVQYGEIETSIIS